MTLNEYQHELGTKVLQLLGVDLEKHDTLNFSLYVSWNEGVAVLTMQEFLRNTDGSIKRLLDGSRAVSTSVHMLTQSGSATPVDPPASIGAPTSCEPSWGPVPGAFEAHFDPDYPKPTPCPECNGTREIQLLTSTVPCKCCGGG